VKGMSLASRPDSLVCPLCEAGQLRSSAIGSMRRRCESCGAPLSGALLEALRGICALPDALGTHPCECGHPRMRRLPDGVFHCPACGSEVVPAGGLGKVEMQGHSARRPQRSSGFSAVERARGRHAKEGREEGGYQK
jgi:ribosomal protein L37AE/L43A